MMKSPLVFPLEIKPSKDMTWLPRDSVSCRSCCSVAKSNGLPFSSCLPSSDIGWSKGWAARRPVFIVLDAWNYECWWCWWAAQVSNIYYTQFRYSAYLFAFRYRFRLFFLQNLVRGSSLSNRTTYLQHLLQTESIWKAYLLLKATTCYPAIPLYCLYTLFVLPGPNRCQGKDRVGVAFARLLAKAKGCEGLLLAAASCQPKICRPKQDFSAVTRWVQSLLSTKDKMYILRISIFTYEYVMFPMPFWNLQNISTWVCIVGATYLQTVLIYGHHLLSSPLATSAISPKANKALSSIEENTLPSSVPPWQLGCHDASCEDLKLCVAR